MSSHKIRVPLQVSDKFALKLKELQRSIRKSTGDEVSLRDLTENLVNTQAFEEIEKKLLNKNINGIDIKLRFDRRIL
jgi:methyltransferase-like protein